MKTFSCSFSPSISERHRKVIRLAFRAWEKSGKVKFIEEPGFHKIIFSFEYLKDGEVGHRAHRPDAEFVQFTTRVTYSTATSWLGRLFSIGGDYDLLSIATHEIGHVLLGEGHNDEPDSIMQAGYINLPSKPSKRDLARV